MLKIFVLTPWGIIPQGAGFFSNLKFEQLGEFFPKIENILTHWSVAHGGLNDEIKL